MRDPNSEKRRNRRIRPNRQLRVGPENGEEQRAGDEGVESGDRGHTGEPGGRQLFRYRDREQRHRGERVCPSK